MVATSKGLTAGTVDPNALNALGMVTIAVALMVFRGDRGDVADARILGEAKDAVGAVCGVERLCRRPG
jgi:hypothetical protein